MAENAIGTTFKKENIFLATVDIPLTPGDVDVVLKMSGFDASTIPEGDDLLEILTGVFSRQECDIFYKDEKGYTRFFKEGNETFVGDNSDGKGELYNIVSAWDYFREEDLCEMVNDKGEPAIVDKVGDSENHPLDRYNQDYNLKPSDK